MAASGTSTRRPVALVTGGRRGIGRAVAEGMAGAGFDVAFTATRNDEVAAQTVATLQAAGAKAMCIAGDIADVADHDRVVAAAEAALGPVDVAVLNAGIAPPQRLDLLETTTANFDAVLNINLRGATFFAQALAKRMVARPRGAKPRTLIFITSCSAEMVSVNRLEYCASKAALAMVAQCFAARLAGEGVAVFEIRPGIIRTDMTAGVTAKYDGLIAGGLVPAARWGEGADIAAAVCALAGGGLAFSTGSVLNVDGGLTISRL